MVDPAIAVLADRTIRTDLADRTAIAVLADRNCLDDLLFATISCCRGLMRRPPVQAESWADLRQRLPMASGGVVLATIQKLFSEELAVARRCELLWRDA